jgi:transposase
MKKRKLYCGIDVSSETLDICYETSEGDKVHKQVKNDKTGFMIILKQCRGDYHFIMESTGIYHTSLMFYLHEQNKVYSVINALQIKRYIQMHLERNKSDKKDARRICEYGIDRSPEPTEMPDLAYFECRSLNNAIDDLTKEITKLTNQIHSISRAPFDTQTIIRSYRSLILKLEKEKKKMDFRLQEKLKEWQPELMELVQTVKGIGKRAASELIIYTRGFKNMTSYRQLISYAGLSPVEFSSGSSIKGRVKICKQGGKKLRHILYMGALNAKVTNRACRELYERLVARGKNKKAAIIAVCNKLLKQVFGVVKNKRAYEDNYQLNFN